MDYRKMFDSDWLRSWDLDGRDFTLTIRKVEAGTLEDKRRGKKEKKPIVHFNGARKPLALNRTNAKTIAALYGNDTSKWIGKAVTLYPTRTSFGNEEMDCIRIRPTAPKGKAAAQLPDRAEPPPADERCETGACGTCTMCRAVAAEESSADGEGVVS